jgi:hypothetical protein
MLRSVVAVIFVALASAAASAAAPPVAVAMEAACEPGKLAPPGDAGAPCVVEGDVTELAAELLVVKFGGGAPEFAVTRATRYAAEDDPQSAKFWRGIADRTTEILKSRSAEPRLSTILSK